VFAIGTYGIMHYDGSSWTTMSSPAVPQRAIWGSGPDDVFVVGDTGTIQHYDGTRWSIMTSPTPQILFGVAGTGPRDVFAVGNVGAIIHYDGTSWTPVRSPLPPSGELFAAWATRRSVFAVGLAGGLVNLVRSCEATETSCSNGLDDDCDGLPDCADPDCAAAPSCTAGGACAPAHAIACGATMTGSTSERTATRAQYTCDANPETGAEMFFRLTPATSSQVTVTLSGFGSTDLDLVVLGATAPGVASACDPDHACIAASSTTQASEAVTFAATAGSSYFIVVDGKDGAAGNFTVAVSCP
jgi:hypothetical protein